MSFDDVIAAGDLIDGEAFFAPAPFDLFDTLMGQYERARLRLLAMAEAVSGDCAESLRYFIKGNCDQQRYTLPTTVGELFKLEPAVAQLDAEFWDRALKMTDVLDVMPQARRNEWYAQIRSPMGERNRYQRDKWDIEPIPSFTTETVRATLEGLIASRGKFFAERVDGIFRGLSREHVTNVPQGFSKRMIVPRIICSFGTVEWSTAGLLNDLRCIVAKFMGREEPKHDATSPLIHAIRRRNGQWHAIDGGALRMRIYNGVGTAHIEVHPDMAWRLNAVLGSIYPQAIPSEFREPRKKPRKVTEAPLFTKPLPFNVLGLLAGAKPGVERVKDPRHGPDGFRKLPKTLALNSEAVGPAREQAEKVLEAIGGVLEKGRGTLSHYRFDYEPGEVIDTIVCSGCIPDHVSHQFYPTPERVAVQALALAEVGTAPGMRWLEPSAGIGNLADRMPSGTRCIEVSELHAAILRSKGHDVVCADFLAMPVVANVDRIVMNPPFSGGRWQAHVEHAAAMLAPGGRMVAIVPASAAASFSLSGMSCTWSAPMANEFAGTSAAVVILTAERPA